jgi:hypothetical protein
MRKLNLHPFLFAIFPPLSIYLNNSGIINFTEIIKPTITLLVFTIAIWFLASRLLGNIFKSACLVSIFLVLFFSFGHFISALQLLAYANQWRNLGNIVGSHLGRLLLLLLWFSVMGIAIFVVMKSRSNFSLVTSFLNVTSIAILVISIAQWGWNEISWSQRSDSSDNFSEAWEDTLQEDSSLNIPLLSGTQSLPDIYYIILDGYASADILESLYNFDNNEFLSWLSTQGFYTADRSHSNYSQTSLSLASSLNLMYLDPIVKIVGEEKSSRDPVSIMMQNNRLFQILRDNGYSIIAYSTGCTLTELKDVEVYLTPNSGFSEFENELLTTTPIPTFLEIMPLKSQFDYHRENIVYTIQHLKDAIEIETPVFVFAHVMAPHPPFVFGASGEPIQPARRFDFSDGSLFTTFASREEYIDGYRNQLTYINSQIKIALEEVLAGSQKPSIIILQGDHGPGSMLDNSRVDNTNVRERMSILNAYYFPDNLYPNLYPEISPVNTFRVILNRYFDTDYELFEDRSFFSILARPYKLYDVTNSLTRDSSGQNP